MFNRHLRRVGLGVVVLALPVCLLAVTVDRVIGGESFYVSDMDGYSSNCGADSGSCSTCGDAGCGSVGCDSVGIGAGCGATGCSACVGGSCGAVGCGLSGLLSHAAGCGLAGSKSCGSGGCARCSGLFPKGGGPPADGSHCGIPAPSYPVPFATPRPTTPTYHMYPPMMPHNSLPHYRSTYSFRHGPGLSRTNVHWRSKKLVNLADYIHHIFELPR